MEARALILKAPGTNCDAETKTAFQVAGATADIIHINELKENKKILDRYSIFVIPGGFSYGDYISAGKILSIELKHFLFEELENFALKGKLIIGICNGFQVLAKMGFLGDVSFDTNKSGRFECRWVRIKTYKSFWTLNMPQVIELPVAHFEGKFVAASAAIRDIRKRVIMRYIDNPDGSENGIASITGKTQNIIGIMPHPERFIFKYQHPLWSKNRLYMQYGLIFFLNAVRYVKKL